MSNLSVQLRTAFERAYEDDCCRPDMVLSQRAWVFAKNELSYAVQRDASGNTHTNLKPYIKNLVIAVWLRSLADLDSPPTRYRSYTYDTRLIVAITDALARTGVRLNKDMELVWLPLCGTVIRGLTTQYLTNPDHLRVAKYAVALMTSSVSHKVASKLARVLDNDDVFTIIDNLHIPAVERMVSWATVSHDISGDPPRSTLLAATSKLSAVINNADEDQLNLTRDLISNYNVTLDMVAHVLELVQSEEARTLSLYALSRGKMYPLGVDWDVVVDTYREIGTAELVEELFGAC